MQSSSEFDGGGPSTSKKTKKSLDKQKFMDVWLVDTELKKWLKRDPKDPYRAVCVLCNTSLVADEGVIKRHGEGRKHLSKTNATSTKPAQTLEERTKTAEISLAAYVAKYNLSPRTVDHLVQLIPNILPDSEIGKNLKMKHMKRQEVKNNISGTAENRDLCED